MDPSELEATAEGDALAGRARDVASAGLVVLPMVAHLVSVGLLAWLHFAGRPVTYRGRKARREARGLDLAILGGAAVCVGIGVAAWPR